MQSVLYASTPQDAAITPMHHIVTAVESTVDEKKSKLKIARVNSLRLIIFISLAVGMAVLGYFGYTFFRNIEIAKFEAQFSSSAELITTSLQRNFKLVQVSTTEVTKLFAYQFPDERQWPFIVMDGYQSIFAYRVRIANARGCVFFPLLHHDTRAAWEVFAADPANYQRVISNASLAALNWTASQGIYDTSPTGQRSHSSGVSIGSPFSDVILPYWQAVPEVTASPIPTTSLLTLYY